MNQGEKKLEKELNAEIAAYGAIEVTISALQLAFFIAVPIAILTNSKMIGIAAVSWVGSRLAHFIGVSATEKKKMTADKLQIFYATILEKEDEGSGACSKDFFGIGMN